MIPKIAFEAPRRSLKFVLDQCDYIFALAHLWTDSEYRNTIFRYKKEGKEVFLDNSAFELSTSIKLDRYLAIIREIKPDIIVVPDAVGNIAETVKLAKIFYQGLPGEFLQRFKFMVVPQGKDNRERLKCFHILRSFGYPFHIIGLPRHACPDRVELMHAIKKFLPRAKIHFLGLPDPKELVGVSSEIYSLDTSWVSKYSIGKGGFDVLDFEEDECDPKKFDDGIKILHNCLSDMGDEDE